MYQINMNTLMFHSVMCQLHLNFKKNIQNSESASSKSSQGTDYHKPITMSYINKRSQVIVGKALTDKNNGINLYISKRRGLILTKRQ